MENGRLQGPWEPLWLVTDCSHNFSLQLNSKEHYLTFPIDVEQWPSNRWQKYKGVCVERIERGLALRGFYLLLDSYWVPVKNHLCSVCLTGVLYLQLWQSVMWTRWLGLGLFSLLDVNKILSHFIKGNSEKAMGYFWLHSPGEECSLLSPSWVFKIYQNSRVCKLHETEYFNTLRMMRQLSRTDLSVASA